MLLIFVVSMLPDLYEFCYGVRGFIEIRHQFLVLIRRLVDAEQLSVAGLTSARALRTLPLKLAAL